MEQTKPYRSDRELLELLYTEFVLFKELMRRGPKPQLTDLGYYDAATTERIMNVDARTLRRYRRRNLIKGIRRGRNVFYEISSIVNYLKNKPEEHKKDDENNG